MGILSNVVESLVGVGVNQLDNWITRSIQQGREEEAFAALAQLDNQIEAKYAQQQSLINGQGILPATNSLTAGAGEGSMPVGVGTPAWNEAMSNASQLPEIDPSIGRSNLASQLAYSKGNQFIQQNPLIQQRAMDEETQKQILKSRGQAFGRLAGQRDIGTADIDPGIRGQMNFTSPELQDAQARGRGKSVTAEEAAREPGRKARFQERMTLKQTPGARAIGSGGGGGKGSGDDTGGIVSSATDTDIRQMSRALMARTEFAQSGLSGKKELNANGQRTLERAAEIIQTQKKKNPLRAVKQAIDEFNFHSSNPPTIDTAGPTTPSQGAPQQTPQEAAAGASGGQDAATQQKISTLKSRGVPPERIKQALEAEGLNPADYGY